MESITNFKWCYFGLVSWNMYYEHMTHGISQPSVVAYPCGRSTWEAEAEGNEGRSWVQSSFEVNLAYMRPCFH